MTRPHSRWPNGSMADHFQNQIDVHHVAFDYESKLNIPHVGPVTRSKSKKLKIGNEVLMTKELTHLIALSSNFADTSNFGYFKEWINSMHESAHSMILICQGGVI